MRNLIRFIDKYSFFFLFLIFEAFAFYLLVRNNRYQQSIFISSSNKLSGGLYETYANWTDYFNLKTVNEELAEENRLLREKQIPAFYKFFGENYYINDTLYERQYHFTKARVINNSVNKQNNYITLNKGSFNGVIPGMGVIGPRGVVGVIKNVSEHYSSALSVLHRNAKISVKLKRLNYYGSLQWDGKNHEIGVLFDIPNHVQLSPGDSILTSGYSSTFPEGLLVGTVLNIEKPDGENFYTIQVKYINDFKNISQVYIVKNAFKAEQNELETIIEEEND